MQYPDFIFYLCVRRKNLHVMSFNSTDEYQKFETLFKQYYSGLVVYASRFTGNTENAEDLVHDLFIHIWEDNRILGTDKSLFIYIYPPPLSELSGSLENPE